MNDFKGIVGSADALLTDMGKATTEGLADARSAAGSALCDARDSVTRQARHSADPPDLSARDPPGRVRPGPAVPDSVPVFIPNRR